MTLLGGSVANEGTIVAELGHVTLAAGRTAIVDFAGDGLIHFAVDGEVLANNGQDDAVSNSGEIRAAGGQVLLTARPHARIHQRYQQHWQNPAGRIDRTGGGASGWAWRQCAQ